MEEPVHPHHTTVRPGQGEWTQSRTEASYIPFNSHRPEQGFGLLASVQHPNMVCWTHGLTGRKLGTTLVAPLIASAIAWVDFKVCRPEQDQKESLLCLTQGWHYPAESGDVCIHSKRMHSEAQMTCMRAKQHAETGPVLHICRTHRSWSKMECLRLSEIERWWQQNPSHMPAAPILSCQG